MITPTVFAKETITVEFSVGPGSPNAPHYLRVIEAANRIQNKYEFVLEFKPGANGMLSVLTMDQSPQNRLATTSNQFTDYVGSGRLNESDYVPVAAQGDACWAIITNIGDSQRGIESLRGQTEITAAGVGFGAASHVNAILIGEKIGFKVRYVVYKSNIEALTQMAGGQPINMVLERIANYKTFKERNPKLQILATTCTQRSPSAPEVKTLREQGVDGSLVFLVTLANVKMPEDRRKELAAILLEAQKQVGAKYLMETADAIAPQFFNPPLPVEDYFYSRLLKQKVLIHRYQRQINEAK